MDLQTINERYGTYIWAIARRYHTGIWSQEDVFNEIIIHIDFMIKEGRLKSDNSEEIILKTKGVIITKAIDIVRKENRRKCRSIYDKMSYEDGEQCLECVEARGLIAPPSQESINFEVWLIFELLMVNLNIDTATFIFKLAFPPKSAIEIAIREQKLARADSGLRMNVNQLKILPRHIAESMILDGILPPSNATISRMRKVVKEILCEGNILK